MAVPYVFFSFFHVEDPFPYVRGPDDDGKKTLAHGDRRKNRTWFADHARRRLYSKSRFVYLRPAYFYGRRLFFLYLTRWSFSLLRLRFFFGILEIVGNGSERNGHLFSNGNGVIGVAEDLSYHGTQEVGGIQCYGVGSYLKRFSSVRMFEYQEIGI